MGSTQLEVERKYDVPPGAVVPALAGVGPVATVDDPVTFQLEAVYHDTADLALARGRTTLRRSTGGEDSGWHLKRPEGTARSERHEPLGDAEGPVPEVLLDEVRALVRDHPVTPVATLRTRRVVHRLRDRGGTVLAELADDTVTAHSVGEDGAATVDSWREWEVELVEGDPDLFEQLAAPLGDAGAAPAAGPSKLARALAGRLEDMAGPEGPEPSRHGAAALVVQANLRTHLDAVVGHDPGARVGVPEDVHKMRVATRRLRSALRTFRPLLDRDVSEPLRGELTWLAGVLGQARDTQVMWDRLDSMVEKEPSDVATTDVRGAMDSELREAHDSAVTTATAALDSVRYFRLLDALDELVRRPPWNPVALGSADDVLRPRVHAEWKRLRRRVRAAQETEPGPDRDEHLHEVRKAAKRLRYAVEAVEPAFGAKAARLAAAAESVQEVLGDLNDSVVTRALLRQLAAESAGRPGNALLYGRMHAAEERHAARAQAQYDAAWHAASRRRLRRWLRS